MTDKKKCYKVHFYSPDHLKNALKHINDGNSITATAKKFKIPKSTLHSKHTGKAPEECKKGPKTNLTAEEENRVEKWILHKAKLGFPMHSDEVKNAVQEVLQEAPRPNTFVDNKPGKKWMDLFLKRHPKITIKNPEAISKGRASVTEENLREWSSDVESHLTEMGYEDVLKKPGSIFNGDEIGMQFCPKLGRLLGEKGEKDFYAISSGKEKETITVLCTFSAAGDALPPMIMFPYKRIPAHLSDSVPDDWPIGRSDSGWMVSSTFYEYIANVFYPWCVKTNVKFPIIYFLDGHKSHLTLELSDFCIKHDIILYSLYPNSTHIIQPCDVAIFKALKCKWTEVIRNHKQKTQKNVTKATFAPLFKEAFDQIDKSSITNGFRVCGLYPFDADAVNYDKCISKRRKDINSEVANNGCEKAPFLTTDDLLSTQKFFNHVLGEKKINEFEQMKNQSLPCDDPIYELWKRCIDGLDMVPVNDIRKVSIQKDNENSVELSSTAFNVISIMDLPVITSLEDLTCVESIESISSIDNVGDILNISSEENCILQKITNDETDFVSCNSISNFDHCDNGAIETLKTKIDSFNNIIVSDPLDNIAGCDSINSFLEENEKSDLKTNESINNDKINNVQGLRAGTHSCFAQDLRDDNNNFTNNNDKTSFEVSSLTTATSTPSKGAPSDTNDNLNIDKQISDVSSPTIVNDLRDNNKKSNKQLCTENNNVNINKPLTDRNSSQPPKTINEIWDQHLSWPEVGEIKKNKKHEKEKLPFAITAPKWREYHQKLREEKEKKALEAKEKIIKRKIKKGEDEIKKQKNKEIREMKKREKERLNEEKLQLKKEKVELKRKLKEENLKAKENRPIKKKKST